MKTKPQPSPGDTFRAALRSRLGDAALDARTTDAALAALACTYPALEDRSRANERRIVVREDQYRSRLAAAMKASGCSERDRETAARVIVEAYTAYAADLPTRHPKATRNECIGAIVAELHPDHRV